MKTLPKFAGDYIGEFPAPAERFHALAAKQPLLEAASESAFAADQKAAQQVKDLTGAIAREEARPAAERDKYGEEALHRQLAAAREARAASEKASKDAVALSYGTRLAFGHCGDVGFGDVAGEEFDDDIGHVSRGKAAVLRAPVAHHDTIHRLCFREGIQARAEPLESLQIVNPKRDGDAMLAPQLARQAPADADVAVVVDDFAEQMKRLEGRHRAQSENLRPKSTPPAVRTCAGDPPRSC